VYERLSGAQKTKSKKMADSSNILLPWEQFQSLIAHRNHSLTL
jgi:hypothetical protein